MRDFNYTVNVLVKAYLNNTLEHGKCAACAVGNIVADCKGTTPAPSDYPEDPGFSFNTFQNGYVVKWSKLFMTNGKSQDRKQPGEIRSEEAMQEIMETGYTEDELAAIEYAFEIAPGRPLGRFNGLNEEWMFNGLMAVVDVLADIHGIDLTQKDAAKLLFAKP